MLIDEASRSTSSTEIQLHDRPARCIHRAAQQAEARRRLTRISSPITRPPSAATSTRETANVRLR